jgi:integrase/recombinase XerD
MKWEAKLIRYKREHRIAIYFENDLALIARIKLLDGSIWRQSNKFWHLPNTATYRERFGLPLMGTSLPSEEGQQAIEAFKQFLKSKRYSESTIKTYSDALRSFLVFYNPKPLVEIFNDDCNPI